MYAPLTEIPDSLEEMRREVLDLRAELRSARATVRMFSLRIRALEAMKAHEWEKHVTDRMYECKHCHLCCYEPHTVTQPCGRGYLLKSRRTKAQLEEAAQAKGAKKQ